MSIFTKDCPQCAETNAAYAVRCKCGFAFSADDGADSQTEEEIAAEEEKLYQEYLAARARQAAGGATKLARDQPADQAKLKEAEEAETAVERAGTELEVQTTEDVDSTTKRQHTKVEPPAGPGVTQTGNVEPALPTPKPPTITPPVQATVPEGTTQSKPAKVAPPAALAVAQTPKAESTPPASKPPVAAPRVQATVPVGTTQTQATKPASEAKQSWLISEAESDAQSDAPIQPPAVKPTPTTPAKPATNARPTPTATKADAAKMSAAERAKKLEQRLKEVQARRDSKAAAMEAKPTSKINKNVGAAKPNPASASVAAAATTHPPAAPAAATPAPVRDPATPQITTAPTAAKTDGTNAPQSSKPTSAALDIKPDQPKTVDKTTPSEPKKVNGSETVPPASDTIEVPAAKEAVSTPGVTTTAKADLEAALQALNTKAPETNPAIPTPTESGNSADQANTGAQELLDTNARAPLADLTQKSSLGCTDKECPNCTALVPMDADHCGCGFRFPTEDDAMPSLSLTDSDVEALEKRKKSSGISHLG